MRAFVAAIAILSSAMPVSASGGLDCTAKDKTVEFSVSGGVTRGMGGPLFSFDGQVDIKDKAVAEDLRKMNFALDHVAQYWFDGDELRLDIYRERDADKVHGYVELVIRTKVKGDEGDYQGTYELMTYDVVQEGGGDARESKYTGKVGCFAE